MDEIVKAALRKWPNVPHCHGWLGLDTRGQWYMRDDRVQALGAFASGLPGAKGSLLRHDKLIEFIHRNYQCDAQGCWYFQNGPQRVYVELEAAPLIWRVDADHSVSDHTGQASGPVTRCLLDELGRVFLIAQTGAGLVHPQDMIHVADLVEAGVWKPEPIESGGVERLGGFVLSPAARQKHIGVAG